MSDLFTEKELDSLKKERVSDDYLKKIESNWEKFRGFLNKVSEPRREKINEMVDAFEEVAIVAPASSRVQFHNSFPGGFIDHSLRVLENSVKLSKSFGMKFKSESLIISALFHDWGKVGDLNNPYYIPHESEWHMKKGMMYNKNESIHMPNAQLGIFTITSRFGIKLSEEEYLSILLNDGQYAPENKPYAMKEPAMSVIIHMADRWSSQCEKNRKSLLDDSEPAF